MFPPSPPPDDSGSTKRRFHVRLLSGLLRALRFSGARPDGEAPPPAHIVERLLTMEREMEENTGFFTMAVLRTTAARWRKDLVEAADLIALHSDGDE